MQRVEIVCSSEIRRGHKENHLFCIHPFFQSTTKWPSRTSICCYYDTFPFSSFPIPLPESYDPQTNTYHCGVGVFCSGSCAKAYLAHHPRHDNAIRLMLLNQLLMDLFQVDNVYESPPISLLKRFGGSLEINEFRQMSSHYMSIVPHQPNFLVCDLAFELIKAQQASSSPDASSTNMECESEQESHGSSAASDHTNSNVEQKIRMVPSSRANKWEIRNLSRPPKSKCKPFKPAQDYRDTISLYSEYLSEQQQVHDKNKSGGRKKGNNASSASSSNTTNTPASAPSQPKKKKGMQRFFT